MIEPTETESRETLDGFINAMIKLQKRRRKTPARHRLRLIRHPLDVWMRQRLQENPNYAGTRKNREESRL